MDLATQVRRKRKLILQENRKNKKSIEDMLKDFYDQTTNLSHEDAEFHFGSPLMTDKESCNDDETRHINAGYHDIGDPIWTCQECGAQMWYGERINKDKKSLNPRFSLCCDDGKIQLPILEKPPDILKELLFGNSRQSKNFQTYIRSYNLMFAFTSPGAKIDRTLNTGKGPPSFRIQGQNHHLIGSLLPMPQNSPKFAQLYIYDTENEVQNRLAHNSNKDSMEEEIVVKIKQMFDHENMYAQTFRMTRDKFCDSSVCDLKLKLICDKQTDGRIYNLPKVAEVAALIVDGYTMIESHRLNYVRDHQQDLMVDKYKNLSQSIDHAQTQGNQRGKMIILPSSFVRSRRYMEQL
ncbi:hypothetical protein D0Y65_026271 [Glycine soja]|uniref:Helitron helicase-like domain-containing protein n=1 Tax=Glycine soja TaxID=3848 RepID=A0A445IJA3_GLYSO|nr:hypothetical protein D0Y65_026271 [Glycine soja]